MGRLCFTDPVWATIEAALLDCYRDRAREQAEAAAAAEARARQLEQDIARATDAFIEATDPALRAGIEKRIETLRSERDRIEPDEPARDVQEQDVRDYLRFARYLMEHLEEILEAQGNVEQQQALARMIFEQLPTYDEIVNGTPDLTLIFKLCAGANDPESLAAGYKALSWNTLDRAITRWRRSADLRQSLPDSDAVEASATTAASTSAPGAPPARLGGPA